MSGRFTKGFEELLDKIKVGRKLRKPMKEEGANPARVNLMAPNLVGSELLCPHSLLSLKEGMDAWEGVDGQSDHL